MWYLTEPVDDLDLVNRMNGRRQAAVDTEDLVIYNNTQSKKIEHVGEIVPDIGVAVFSSAFGVETVRLRDTPRFMVSSDQMDSFGVSEL